MSCDPAVIQETLPATWATYNGFFPLYFRFLEWVKLPNMILGSTSLTLPSHLSAGNPQDTVSLTAFLRGQSKWSPDSSSRRPHPSHNQSRPPGSLGKVTPGKASLGELQITLDSPSLRESISWLTQQEASDWDHLHFICMPHPCCASLSLFFFFLSQQGNTLLCCPRYYNIPPQKKFLWNVSSCLLVIVVLSSQA